MNYQPIIILLSLLSATLLTDAAVAYLKDGNKQTLDASGSNVLMSFALEYSSNTAQLNVLSCSASKYSLPTDTKQSLGSINSILANMFNSHTSPWCAIEITDTVNKYEFGFYSQVSTSSVPSGCSLSLVVTKNGANFGSVALNNNAPTNFGAGTFFPGAVYALNDTFKLYFSASGSTSCSGATIEPVQGVGRFPGFLFEAVQSRLLDLLEDMGIATFIRG